MTARAFEPKFMKMSVLTAALQELTPRRVRELAPQIQRIVDHHLDRALAALRELCHDGAGRARDDRLRAELVAIGRQLDRPLQLAVAGAVSAGKSTLINALLRRSVAPADAGECTRLVTWYEHGEDGVVHVECADGSTRRGQAPTRSRP